MLFAPLEFLIALPELAINLLSGNGNMRMIYFHYNSVLVPFIYFSTIVGYNRMRNLIKSLPDQRLLTALFICTNLYFIYRYAPLPFKFFKEPYFAKPIDEEKMSSVKEIQNMLADESIPISTSPQLAPFFTRRQYFYNFLYDSGFRGAGLSEDDIIKDMDLYKKAEYIVISTWEVDAEGSLSQKFYKNFLMDGDYKKIYEKNDIMVYRKQI